MKDVLSCTMSYKSKTTNGVQTSVVLNSKDQCQWRRYFIERDWYECKSYHLDFLNCLCPLNSEAACCFLVHSHENYLLCCVDILIILSLKDQRANQQCENEDTGPLILNAFDMIILSQGLNLASLFDRGQVFNHDIFICLLFSDSNHMCK